MTSSSDPAPEIPSTKPAPKGENLIVSIVCNIVLPAVILSYLSKPERLGPAGGLILALAFPLGYGIVDFLQRRKTNFISIVSFIGVMLTGGLGLMKLGGIWFAVKDAAISGVLGIAVLWSVRTREPLIKTIFCNETVMDVPRVEAALKERGTESGYNRLLRQCTLIIAAAFFVSGLLGYSLARWLLKSPPGTEQFNAELAKMHWLSWPVIVVPCMILMMVALWWLLKNLKVLTGLTTDEIFKAEAGKK